MELCQTANNKRKQQKKIMEVEEGRSRNGKRPKKENGITQQSLAYAATVLQPLHSPGCFLPDGITEHMIFHKMAHDRILPRLLKVSTLLDQGQGGSRSRSSLFLHVTILVQFKNYKQHIYSFLHFVFGCLWY